MKWFGFVLSILLPGLCPGKERAAAAAARAGTTTAPQVELWHLRMPAARVCAEQMKDYSDQFGEKGDFSPSVYPQGSISS